MDDSVPAPPSLEEGPDPTPQVPLGTWVLAALALAVGIALALSTCSAPQRTVFTDLSGIPSVGAETLYTLLLPRGDIVAAQQTDNSPLFVRIKSIQPTDNQQFSYLLSYSGIERGTFNLTDYLCTPNGNRLRAGEQLHFRFGRVRHPESARSATSRPRPLHRPAVCFSRRLVGYGTLDVFTQKADP